jgi:hypothetical protein
MRQKGSFILLFTLLCSSILAIRAGNAELHQELALARAATATYHNVDHAIADGYVQAGDPNPGEGIHYANFALIDGNFEIERPEALVYREGPNGQLRLAGVEYLVLQEFSPEAPDGFSGDEDVWRDNLEGLGAWELNVWIWFHNPHGVFAASNPELP